MARKSISVTIDESQSALAARPRLRARESQRRAQRSDYRGARRQLGTPPPVRSVVGTIDLAGRRSRARTGRRCGPGPVCAVVVTAHDGARAARRDGRVARARPRGVADPHAAVTDTHALLFHASRASALGRRAAAHFDACERQQALTYVPMAVIWEVGPARPRQPHQPARRCATSSPTCSPIPSTIRTI